MRVRNRSKFTDIAPDGTRTVVCKHCNQPFTYKHVRAPRIYCSQPCRDAADKELAVLREVRRSARRKKQRRLAKIARISLAFQENKA